MQHARVTRMSWTQDALGKSNFAAVWTPQPASLADGRAVHPFCPNAVAQTPAFPSRNMLVLQSNLEQRLVITNGTGERDRHSFTAGMILYFFYLRQKPQLHKWDHRGSPRLRRQGLQLESRGTMKSQSIQQRPLRQEACLCSSFSVALPRKC